MSASLAASLPRPRGGLLAGTLPAGIFLVLALVPIVALFTGGSYLVSLGSRVMIFAIAAVALDLLIGYSALTSFGHAAFIGLGAYAVGILSAYGISDALVSLPAALAVSAAYAFLTGVVCLRTKGVYFIMITLAFGQMALFTASSLAPFGGDVASMTLPRPPVSLSSGDEVPHIFTRKSRLQPGEFLITSANRLLRQYPPQSGHRELPRRRARFDF